MSRRILGTVKMQTSVLEASSWLSSMDFLKLSTHFVRSRSVENEHEVEKDDEESMVLVQVS